MSRGGFALAGPASQPEPAPKPKLPTFRVAPQPAPHVVPPRPKPAAPPPPEPPKTPLVNGSDANRRQALMRRAIIEDPDSPEFRDTATLGHAHESGEIDLDEGKRLREAWSAFEDSYKVGLTRTSFRKLVRDAYAEEIDLASLIINDIVDKATRSGLPGTLPIDAYRKKVKAIEAGDEAVRAEMQKFVEGATGLAMRSDHHLIAILRRAFKMRRRERKPLADTSE